MLDVALILRFAPLIVLFQLRILHLVAKEENTEQHGLQHRVGNNAENVREKGGPSFPSRYSDTLACSAWGLATPVVLSEEEVLR